MIRRLRRMGYVLAKEPPLRLFSKSVLKALRVHSSLRGLWDISPRPQYLLGLLTAATQARMQGETAFTAVEFGVAKGQGLLAMQAEAEAVANETGIDIRVFGFDTGSGLGRVPIDVEKSSRGSVRGRETRG